MEHLWGWAAMLLAAIVLLLVTLRESRIAAPLWCGFLARAAIALIHVYGVSLTQGKGDAANFMRYATSWSTDGVLAAVANFHAGSQLYSWLLSVIFAATSPSELTALAINILFGTLVVWNVWRLAESVTGSAQAARVAAWWIALFPSLVLFSAMTIREVAVLYPLTLGLYALVRWWRDQSGPHFYLALVAFGLSAQFHPGIFALILAQGFLLACRWSSSFIALRGAVFRHATMALLAVGLVGAFAVGTKAGLYKLGGRLTLEALADGQQSAARSRAAYLEGYAPTDPVGFVAQVPVRTVFLLFTPFPWMVRSPGDVVAFADAAAYLLAFIAIGRARKRLWAAPASRALLIALMLGVAPFAISTSNYGTALRHRAKFLPVIAVLYAAAQSVLSSSRSREVLPSSAKPLQRIPAF